MTEATSRHASKRLSLPREAPLKAPYRALMRSCTAFTRVTSSTAVQLLDLRGTGGSDIETSIFTFRFLVSSASVVYFLLKITHESSNRWRYFSTRFHTRVRLFDKPTLHTLHSTLRTPHSTLKTQTQVSGV